MSQFRWGGRRGRVGVVGAGYVGAAVADAFGTVASMMIRDPRHGASVEPAALAAADVVFVCVPTPAGPDGAADTSTVEHVVGELAAAQTDAVVVVKSTVPPGTTARLAETHPTLALVHAPEFLRERWAQLDFDTQTRILLGWPTATRASARARVQALYRARFPGVAIVETSATEAELVKYASNAFFAIKVSFANEIAELATALGVAWDGVRAALATDPRIGKDHLAVPGPDGELGYGGRCLPKDVAALLHLATRVGVDLPLVERARAVNDARREPAPARDVHARSTLDAAGHAPPPDGSHDEPPTTVLPRRG